MRQDCKLRGFYYYGLVRLEVFPMTQSARGSCLCKAVVFEVDLPTLYCGHCHCSMCRKNHGAGYVTWFGVPHTRFRVLEGQSSIERYQSSEHGWRCFCKRCGSPLFSNDGKKEPTNIHIPLAVMDGPTLFARSNPIVLTSFIGRLPVPRSCDNHNSGTLRCRWMGAVHGIRSGL
jgi:hypothetical protein